MYHFTNIYRTTNSFYFQVIRHFLSCQTWVTLSMDENQGKIRACFDPEPKRRYGESSRPLAGLPLTGYVWLVSPNTAFPGRGFTRGLLAAVAATFSCECTSPTLTEHIVHIDGVTGSSPVATTRENHPERDGFFAYL